MGSDEAWGEDSGHLEEPRTLKLQYPILVKKATEEKASTMRMLKSYLKHCANRVRLLVSNNIQGMYKQAG
jgi:hypothetical protein